MPTTPVLKPGPALVTFDDGASPKAVQLLTGGGTKESADKFNISILCYNGSGSGLVAGDVVQWDLATSGYVYGKWVKKTAATDDDTCMGVCNEIIANGSWGSVTRKGIVNAKFAGAVAVRGLVQVSDTAGAFEATELITNKAVGTCVVAATDAIGTVDLW